MAKLNWTPFAPPRQIALFRNTDDKALDVHYGGVVRTDGTSYPDRPWMMVAAEEMFIANVFTRSFKSLAGSGSLAVARHALDHALESTARQLHQAMLDNLTDERWEWDRETIRSDSSVASSPRNIRDTDELYNSQILEYTDNPADAETEQVDF